MHDPEFVLQVPEKPDRTMLPSDVNLTCMYPVDDVYSVLGLTEGPDSAATTVAEEHDVADEDEEHSLIVTVSQQDSVSKDQKLREICAAPGVAIANSFAEEQDVADGDEEHS